MNIIRNKKKTAGVVTISVVLFVFHVLFADIFFESNDDTVMNLMAVDAYGYSQTQYLVYINIVLGWMIRSVYAILPGTNVYLWMFLLLNFISITVICLIITDPLDEAMSCVLTVIVSWVLAKDYYVAIQFTKSAPLYISAGCLILYHLFQTASRRLLSYVAAGFLICIGFMVRHSVMPALFPFFVLAIARLIVEKKTGPGRLWIICTVVITLIACVCYAANAVAYSSEEWSSFNRWNYLRSEIVDYGPINYYIAPDQFREAGISEIQIGMLAMGMTNDPDVFTEDFMQTVRDIVVDVRDQRLRMNAKVLTGSVQWMLNAISGKMIPLVFLVLLLIILIRGDRTDAYLFSSFMFLIWLQYYYLTCLGRVIWRAEIAVWIFPTLMALYTVLRWIRRQAESKEIKRVQDFKGIVVSVLSILLILLSLISVFREQKGGHIFKEADFESETIALIRNAGYGFMAAGGFYFSGNCGAENIFSIDKRYTDYYVNTAYIGGWPVPSPVSSVKQREYGIENLFRALYERDDVCLITDEDHAQIMKIYLQVQYEPEVQMEQINEVNGVQIWKYHIE